MSGKPLTAPDRSAANPADPPPEPAATPRAAPRSPSAVPEDAGTPRLTRSRPSPALQLTVADLTTALRAIAAGPHRTVAFPRSPTAAHRAANREIAARIAADDAEREAWPPGGWADEVHDEDGG